MAHVTAEARRRKTTSDYLRQARLHEHAKQRDESAQQTLKSYLLPQVYTDLDRAERFSDTGDAILLEARFGDELRYVTAWGWLAYHDGKWDGEDGEKLCERRVEQALRPLARVAADKIGSDEGTQLFGHAKAAFNRVGYIRQAAARRERFLVRPDLFDAHPTYLNVKNGVIDLESGKRYDHKPGFYLTKQAAAEYHADERVVQAAAKGDPAAVAQIAAGCPQWLKFLSDVFQDDTALISYMQKALGYTLTTSTQEHALFILYGGGRNGKSSLLNTLAGVLGDYAKPVKPEVLVHQGVSYRGETSADPELAQLNGVRLVTSVEPSGGEDKHGKNKGKLDEARVKSLSGGDQVSVRRLHQMPFTLVPQFKLFLACNDLPAIEKSDEAIWLRIKPIPFNARFTPGEPGHVPDIHKVLLAKEASGILAWLVVGALRFYHEGLGSPPKSVAELISTYHRREAPYDGFFEDEVRRDPEGAVPLDEAYKRFEAWAKRNEGDVREALDIPDTYRGFKVPFTPPNKTKFAAMCADQNYTKKRRKTGFVLLGMRLVTPEEQQAAEEQAEEDEGASGVGGCSKTPLYTDYPTDDSYKENCVDPHFATPPYTAPTPPTSDGPLDASEPNGPLASSGPKIVPVLTSCLHRHLTVKGERAVCADCGERWDRAADITPCPHTTLLDGRCTACGWQRERPAVGGCTHPLAAYDPVWEGIVCPHCKDVTERERGGMERGRIRCHDSEAHRADWDGLGCPHCWTQPADPRTVTVELDLPPLGAKPWERSSEGQATGEAGGDTWADAYALLPTCPHARHERARMHLDVMCPCTGLATGVPPQRLPGGAAQVRRDADGAVAGPPAGVRVPLADEAVAALALARGRPITSALRDKLDALWDRHLLERQRWACPHQGETTRIHERGKRPRTVCADCGADMTPGGGYI